MEKRLKRKIKNRVWLFSLIMLMCSLIAVISSHTIWIKMLPIIVPTSTLTLGITIYNISKYIKINNKSLEIEPKTSGNNLDNDCLQKDDYTSIDSYSKIYVEDEYYEATQERNKIKTKGTIH